MGNGRPGTGYQYWKWSPKSCELPHFDPKKFLELMRDKTWAFVGDSITRNYLQSFICLLSQVEDAVEIYHDKDYMNRIWNFPTYNLQSRLFGILLLQKPTFLKTSTVFHLQKSNSTLSFSTQPKSTIFLQNFNARPL